MFNKLKKITAVLLVFIMCFNTTLENIQIVYANQIVDSSSDETLAQSLQDELSEDVTDANDASQDQIENNTQDGNDQNNISDPNKTNVEDDIEENSPKDTTTEEEVDKDKADKENIVDENLETPIPFSSSMLLESEFSETIYVSSVQDLKDISKNLSGNYVLMNDIDLNNEGWIAIGTSSKPFIGVFDGNGHKIKNLKIGGISDNKGLFGYVTYAEINNLIIENVSITSNGYSGGVVGVSKHSTIKNCAVIGVGSISGVAYVGGIVGYTENSIIEECYTDIDVLTTDDTRTEIGGIIGKSVGNTIIRNCFSQSNVTGGGLIGKAYAGDKIEKSYFIGKINNKQQNLSNSSVTIIDSYVLGISENDFKIDGNNIVKSSEELQDTNTFLGWNFENVWEISDDLKYPILKGLNETVKITKGTLNNPVLISNIEDLKFIKTRLNASYKLVNDIDLNNEIWTTLGDSSKPFTGTFDGNGYKIKNLKITGVSNNKGLFGYATYAIIKNLVVENVSITSNGYAGGVAGVSKNSTIKNCAVIGVGSVSGIAYIGGIVGYTENSMIEQCYTDIDILTTDNTRTEIGGIIGKSVGNTIIRNCFSQSNVTGGGLIGTAYSSDKIEKSYFIGKINNKQQNLSNSSITIIDSYVLGISENDFKSDGNNIVKSSEELQNTNTFLGWNFEDVWEISDDLKYPILKGLNETIKITEGTLNNPVLISNIEDLKLINARLNASYKLINDIDLNNEVWTTLGDSSKSFTGTFNGNGYKIKNLKITGILNNKGLFGYATYSIIKNLIVENVSITSNGYAGGVVGVSKNSTIKDCTAIGVGSISGIAYVGGIVGYTENSIIEQCYADVDILTTNNTRTEIGGIIGKSGGNTIIRNCFSQSNVNGGGGLIGTGYASDKIENSYFAGTMPKNKVRLSYSAIPTISSYFDLNKAENGNYLQGDQAKTTDQLKQKASFLNWNFENVWNIDEGVSYPYLREKVKEEPIQKDLPNNTYPLTWPTDSREVTLWFGELDHFRPTVFNNGLDIQGNLNSTVYSVSEGVISEVGNSPFIGKYVLVDFSFNNEIYQAKYANMDNIIKKSGDKILSGEQIGTMDMYLDKGLLEISFNKKDDADNYIEPKHFLLVPDTESDYLTKPMSARLDRYFTAFSQSEEEMRQDLYAQNYGIDTTNEVYIRKIVDLYNKDKKYIDLTFDDKTKIATLKDNKNNIIKFGESLGNARIVPETWRLSIKKADFNKFIIGSNINDSREKAIEIKYGDTINGMLVKKDDVAWYKIGRSLGGMSFKFLSKVPGIDATLFYSSSTDPNDENQIVYSVKSDEVKNYLTLKSWKNKTDIYIRIKNSSSISKNYSFMMETLDDDNDRSVSIMSTGTDPDYMIDNIENIFKKYEYDTYQKKYSGTAKLADVFDSLQNSDIVYMPGHAYQYFMPLSHNDSGNLEESWKSPKEVLTVNGESYKNAPQYNKNVKVGEIGGSYISGTKNTTTILNKDLEWLIISACSILNHPSNGGGSTLWKEGYWPFQHEVYAAEAWARTLLADKNSAHGILAYFGSATADPGTATESINFMFRHMEESGDSFLDGWRKAGTNLNPEHVVFPDGFLTSWAAVVKEDNIEDGLYLTTEDSSDSKVFLYSKKNNVDPPIVVPIVASSILETDEVSKYDLKVINTPETFNFGELNNIIPSETKDIDKVDIQNRLLNSSITPFSYSDKNYKTLEFLTENSFEYQDSETPLELSTSNYLSKEAVIKSAEEYLSDLDVLPEKGTYTTLVSSVSKLELLTDNPTSETLKQEVLFIPNVNGLPVYTNENDYIKLSFSNEGIDYLYYNWNMDFNINLGNDKIISKEVAVENAISEFSTFDETTPLYMSTCIVSLNDNCTLAYKIDFGSFNSNPVFINAYTGEVLK